MTENIVDLQRGRPFAPGESGNPAGRPKGALNKATLAAQALFDGDAEALSGDLLQRAKNGNMIAARICLDRIVPRRREAPVAFTLPAVYTVDDAIYASNLVLAGVGNGELTPGEGAKLMGLLAQQRSLVQLSAIERRMEQVERRIARL